jgi:uncharacterized RDD family membrane protein YckC
MIDADKSRRAGFQHRALAFILDWILVSVLVSAIGVVLGIMTDGKVRVGDTMLSSSTCTSGEAIPPGLDLPADFKATEITRCTSYLFGMAHDWTLKLAETTRIGPRSTFTRSGTVALDRAGHVTDAFYLDNLTVFVVFAYLLILEWRFGTTAAKRMLGIRVRSLGGDPMSFVQAGRRALMRMIPFLAVIEAPFYEMSVGSVKPFPEWPVTVNLVAVATWLLIFAAFAVNFAAATRRRALPWHDRWARTEAVYDPPFRPT